MGKAEVATQLILYYLYNIITNLAISHIVNFIQYQCRGGVQKM